MVPNLRSLYVMFRSRIVFALTIIASFAARVEVAAAPGTSVAGRPIDVFERRLAATQGATLEAIAGELSGRAGAGTARRLDIAGASDLVAAYAFGTTAPYVAFVVSKAAPGESRWSEVAWLSLFERLSSGGVPDAGASGSMGATDSGTVLLLVFDDNARAAPPGPGDPLLRNPRLPAALSDLGVGALLVFDLDGAPDRLRLRAASWKKLAPRRVVETARRASRESGISCGETPIDDFYAAAGMSTGAVLLAPWLEAGVPALVLESARHGQPADTSADPSAWALAFASGTLATLARPEASVSGDDVNYLRYPLPGGSLIVPDAVCVAALLLVLAAVATALALGWLKGGKRPPMFGAVMGEALAAIFVSLAALYGARVLSMTAYWVAGAWSGARLEPRDGSELAVAMALAARAVCALAAYYVASGLLARTGLFRSHRRVDAARAALALLGLDSMAAAILYPPALPFLLFALIVATLASVSAASATIGLVSVLIVASPFFDPRIIAAVGDATGGPGSVAMAILGAGWRGNAILAAFIAPFGLWVGVASSPASRIRRGRRTTLFWLVMAVAMAAVEVAARMAGGPV